MEKAAKSVERLIVIRGLLADPSAWTKAAMARASDGRAVSLHGGGACMWCLDGALSHDAPGGSSLSAFKLERVTRSYVRLALGGLDRSIWGFNDDPSTTHADILAVLDRAIELAKQEGATP